MCDRCRAREELTPSEITDWSTSIHQLMSCVVYQDIYKELVHRLKFDRQKEAYEHIAWIMSRCYSPNKIASVIPLPTSAKRVRQRGYDQTVLIARRYAQLTGCRYIHALRRNGDGRQVGATRSSHFDQMKGVFYIPNPRLIIDQDVILVDDVVTTGASLQSAANELLNAGAKSVAGLVFARA